VYVIWRWIGACVNASIRNDSYGAPYGVGDVIGCYINLDDDSPVCNEIRFFKNGQDQGVAYSGSTVPYGVYFPAISIFMRVIFGRLNPSRVDCVTIACIYRVWSKSTLVLALSSNMIY
jgi:hypothetical protein